MKKFTLFPALLVAGTVAATALVPVAASAHDTDRSNQRQAQGHAMIAKGHAMLAKGGPRGAGGNPIDFTCAPNGVERLEVAFDRIQDTVDLTDEQVTLFDELKATALTAGTEFADSCTMPVRGPDTDIIDRMKNRQANMQAYLNAVDGVMPSLEAFFDSLTDEQKAAMATARFEHMRDGMGPGMGQGQGQGQGEGRWGGKGWRNNG